MNAVEQRAQANKQKATAEIAQAQKDNKYPGEHVPDNFRSILNAALANKSQFSAQCDWPMFRSLILDDVKEFNLEQMGVALNAIESTSIFDLSRSSFGNVSTLEEYVAVMDMQQEMAKKWNEVWTPIVDAITKKYQNIPPLFIPHGKKK